MACATSSTWQAPSARQSEPDWPAGQEPDAPPRNSRDTETCKRGKRLLQLCQAHGLRFCSSRVEGDDPGAPTSYGIGGRRSSKSVVDYFLLPAALLPQVESLRVEDLAVGDHGRGPGDHGSGDRQPGGAGTAGTRAASSSAKTSVAHHLPARPSLGALPPR